MAARLVDRTVGIGDGIDLHYVEAGEGRPLIIIPSWSLTGAAYRRQVGGAVADAARDGLRHAWPRRIEHAGGRLPGQPARGRPARGDRTAGARRGRPHGPLDRLVDHLELYRPLRRGPPRAADLRGPGAVGDGEARLVGGGSRHLWLPAAGPRGPRRVLPPGAGGGERRGDRARDRPPLLAVAHRRGAALVRARDLQAAAPPCGGPCSTITAGSTGAT